MPDIHIARSYVPESVGLEAIAYGKKMVGLLDLDDIEQAHDEAIRLTQIKFAFEQRLRNFVNKNALNQIFSNWNYEGRVT